VPVRPTTSRARILSAALAAAATVTLTPTLAAGPASAATADCVAPPVAHRGASAAAPENTIPAYRAALRAGISRLDLDVRFTRTGIPVVMHDSTVDRTTDGTGRVSGMTLAELRSLDAGSWFSPEFAGVKVPTLRQALEFGRTRGASFQLELKGRPTAQQLDDFLNRIRWLGMLSRVRVIGFDEETVGQVRAKEPGVAAAIGPADDGARDLPGLLVAEDAGAARYLLVLDQDPQGGKAVDVLERLRERVPALLDDAGLGGANASFAGDTALAQETVDTIMHDLLRIGIAAFLVNFLLLAIFLRALVAPLYLVFCSALALAASIGLTTLVFQTLLGHDELTYHVPFAVAVLLLSLGSDYNVFVVGSIWQQAEDRPLREAIATAAPRASRAIGVAGLALALSFASLAIIELRQFREFAFAMSVGVLLDAFLVRALLIPALVSLVGERSWWPRTRRAAVEPEPETTAA